MDSLLILISGFLTPKTWFKTVYDAGGQPLISYQFAYPPYPVYPLIWGSILALLLVIVGVIVFADNSPDRWRTFMIASLIAGVVFCPFIIYYTIRYQPGKDFTSVAIPLPATVKNLEAGQYALGRKKLTVNLAGQLPDHQTHVWQLTFNGPLAEQLAHKLQVGQTVTLLVHPQQPRDFYAVKWAP